ncbi:auxin response factor 18 [Ricinus communis]|uniref:Auxin response factor n=1 Tax=Ricinus communis TaxID=3988 RepID=B9SVC2_RICCO|nr:auxin response factor 18 [Ricinus communis]EEF32449.1 Auxin response factor, putative [Ricinus communis]|eukprot:XP_002529941.1 auxin response factor 18 [Ricinus communis]
MKEVEKRLDPQLWHACAGSMVQIPPINSKVFYFPQGHAEHSQSPVDFSSRIPSLVLCRVAGVKYLADSETDEVYAKISLFPLPSNELDFGDEIGLCDTSTNGTNSTEKPTSFAKTLTQSDANNGGGFSVPRYCAETIFPRLDYSADPPVQTVVAKDVHGEIWKFRHIYRGTPRRHLLTTGWSTFVNQKKLVAGDSIVFLRAESGDLCVGIRRAKRGIGGGNGPESSPPSGWTTNASCVNPYTGGFSLFLKEDESKGLRNGGGIRGKVRVKAEEVLESAALAANGQPFEVVYYPRASTPEFCVKASSVRASTRIQWCSGMRFKMAFETEDSSRISWFMGTIASVQVADPIRWPNSPWRLLQVTWDEPDLLQNVKRVSPWLVELVSNMPVIHLSPFSPPRKKLRLPQHLDFPLDGQFQLPSFSGNPLGPSSPLCCLSDNTPAGIQGARHAQFGISLSDLQLNKLQSGLFLSSLQRFNSHSRVSESFMKSNTNSNENLSCLLTMGNSNTNSEKSDNVKRHQFVLFGQPILTEQQISRSCSTDAVSQVLSKKLSSDESPEKAKIHDVLGSTPEKQTSPEKSASTGLSWQSLHTTETGLDAGHCKVFLESEDVGRTLDLSVLGSYEELYSRLANMFGIERSEMLHHVLYRDAAGAIRQTGDEPFSVFAKTAKRLTILMNPASSDNIGRPWIRGMRSTENGLEASNKADPLSIFA